MKKLQQLFKDAVKARHVARLVGMEETIFYKKLKGTYNTKNNTFTEGERKQVSDALLQLAEDLKGIAKQI